MQQAEDQFAERSFAGARIVRHRPTTSRYLSKCAAFKRIMTGFSSILYVEAITVSTSGLEMAILVHPRPKY